MSYGAATSFSTQDTEKFQKEVLMHSALRIKLANDGKKASAYEASALSGATFNHCVMGQLLNVKEGFQLGPGQISDFRWDFKNHWYELELASGLRFHNGRDATIDDLEFSISRAFYAKKMLGESMKMQGILGSDKIIRGSGFQPWSISGIQRLSNRSLRISMANPNPKILYALSHSKIILVPREELEDDLTTWKHNAVGAGNFRVVQNAQVESGSVLVESLSKLNARSPTFVEFLSGPSSNEPDIVALEPSMPNAKKYQKVDVGYVYGIVGIFFNYGNMLSRNHLFREAVWKAISRGNLEHNSDAFIPTNEILPHHFPGRLNVPERYDPEESKKLVSKLKFDMGKEPLEMPAFNMERKGDNEKLMLSIERQLDAVGLKTQIKSSQKKLLDSTDAKVPFRLVTIVTDYIDPLLILSAFAKGSPNTLMFPQNNEGYLQVLLDARNAASTAEQEEKSKKLSEIFQKEFYAVPLLERKALFWVDNQKVETLGKQYLSTLFVEHIILK